ncbi:MAG: WD40 repeat domain-containing protein [Candidatus Binataceae bacterium]
MFRLRSRSTTGEDEAAAFVKLLIEASNQTALPVYVAITMRSDFLGDCSEFRGLPEALNRSQYLIPRMTRDQRREAIEGPVAVGGAKITPRLVQRLLNDVGDDPDQLPILQHALMRTWDAWVKTGMPESPIDLDHYESIGGMATALSRHADEAFDELDARGKAIARRLFQCLTDSGTTGRQTRHPTSLAAICAIVDATQAEVTGVIDKFRTGGRTFLMPPAQEKLGPDSIIDISHESLIRLWNRLQGWVTEEAEFAALYKRLADSARRYEAGQAALWRNPELQLALDWKKRENANEHWAARYDSGFAAAMRFLARSRRTSRLRYGVAFGLVAVMIALAYVTMLARQGAQEDAQEARRSALHVRAHDLAAQSDEVRDRDPQLAALLGIESLRHTPTLEGDIVVRRASNLLLPPGIALDLKAGAVLLDANGKHLAATSQGAVRVYDAETGHQLSQVPIAYRGSYLEFSPDGKLIAVADKTGGWTLIDWSSARTLQLWPASVAEELVEFSADNKLLAAADRSGNVDVFDLSSGQTIAHRTGPMPAEAIAFSPDGKYLLVSWKTSVELFATSSGKQIWTHATKNLCYAVAYSPDGNSVAIGTNTGVVLMLETILGHDLKQFQVNNLLREVRSLWFTARGRSLAIETPGQVDVFEVGFDKRVWSSNGFGGEGIVDQNGWYIAAATRARRDTLRVFDFGTGRVVFQSLFADGLRAASISTDGQLLAVADSNGTVRTFRLPPPLDIVHVGYAAPHRVAFSANGQYMAMSDTADHYLVFDSATLRANFSAQSASAVDALALDASGKLLAAGNDDGLVRIVDAASGKVLATSPAGDSVNSVSFAPDSGSVAAVSDDTITMLAAATAKPMWSQPSPTGTLAEAAFSPDGRYVVICGTKGLSLYDAATGKSIARFLDGNDVISVAFGPGSRLAAVRRNGTIIVLDYNTGRELWLWRSNISSIQFSPNGKVVAGRSTEGIEVYDATDGRQIATMVPGADVDAFWISPDSATLAIACESVASVYAEVFILKRPLGIADLIASACSMLTRNLSPSEWKQYLPDEPYEQTCPNLPVPQS